MEFLSGIGIYYVVFQDVSKTLLLLSEHYGFSGF